MLFRSYEIGRGTDLAFAPLQHIDDPSDMAWAEEWIATLVELQGLAVGPGYRNAIHNAMVLLRANPRNMRSLTAFVHFVQEPAVAEALLPYTQQGTMGRLLDAEEEDGKSTRLNSSHLCISYAVFFVYSQIKIGRASCRERV